MNTSKTPTRRGADAFHPRQTILSEPLHPTHPRQTLIQPAAPQEPPKILPALPNIVQLAESQPARPKLQLTVSNWRPCGPRRPRLLRPRMSAAPDVAAPEKEVGAINIASSTQAPPKPVLPVSPMSAPRAATQKSETNAAAPEIAGRNGESGTLIALSATPAPWPRLPRSRPEIFRRAFRFRRMDRNPARPAAPGKSAHWGSGGSGPRPGRHLHQRRKQRKHRPDFGTWHRVCIARNWQSVAFAAAPRARIAPKIRKRSVPIPVPPMRIPNWTCRPKRCWARKQVYTLHVNMPNLTSASGSWVLNFAELDETDRGAYSESATADLAGPFPCEKWIRSIRPSFAPCMWREKSCSTPSSARMAAWTASNWCTAWIRVSMRTRWKLSRSGNSGPRKNAANRSTSKP